MKKTLILTLFLLAMTAAGLTAQDVVATASDPGQQKIAMYYFHTSFRCATCRAVEEQSKVAFESLYVEQFKSGNASFQAMNIEEDSSAEVVEKFKITGQTLLVVKGEKSADLTSQGFLYAKTNPEKLKEEIRKAVENL